MAGTPGAYVLSNRERFRSFFQILPSFEFVGPSLAEIARKFGWNQMAIVTQKESLFTLVGLYQQSPMHISYYNTCNIMYTQVTESLSDHDMFKSEKQVLDTNATIELNADPFPYELVFNWVYNNYSSVPVRTCCETKKNSIHF